MAPLSCHDAEELIELCAAGEADPPTLAAVERHAEACPDCAAALDEARRLVALLDLRFREPERLELLRERVETAAPRRRRSTALPIFKRALAVAAMVLVAVGVLPRQDRRDDVGPVAVAGVRSASPGAKWAERGGGIELSSGELWLSRKDQTGPLKVTTSAGVLDVEGHDCFIKVRPDAGVEVSVRQGRVTLSNAHGRVTARHGEAAEATATTAPRKQVEALALRFGERYKPVKVVAGRAAAAVPLDPGRAVNFDAMSKRFALDKVLSLLKAEGFAALPGDKIELRPFYRKLRDDDVPTVVTADAVLHLCRAHLQETLRDIEERVLFADLKLLLQALMTGVQAEPENPQEWQVGGREAVAYLAVPLAVLDPEAAAKEMRGAADSLLAAQSGRVRIAGREIDPADFRPEGHYLRSDRLRRYYAATVWLSHVPLSAENRREALVALLVTRALESARLPDARTARAAWERIDAIASYFVSLSDDLGPAQYAAAGARAKAASLNWADHGSLDMLRTELVKFQTAGVRGAPIPWGDLGFRLFGRRTLPDAGVFALLTGSHIGPGTRPDAFTAGRTRAGGIVRAVPRGLDLMAVLGSGRARELLRELGDDAYRGGKGKASYPAALSALQREYADHDTLDWNRNLYWSWLHALRPLLVDGPTSQPFQAGPGYRTRLLNTALASWAQRRQDVALYAPPELAREMAALKLGPETRSPKVPPVFIEPLPDLYARLLALSRMTREGLDSLGALDGAARTRLDGLSQSLERLVAVAEKEAAGKAPSAADEAFLRGVVDQLERAAVVRDEPGLLELGHQLIAAKAAKDEKRIEALTLKALGAAGGSVRSPSLATVFRGPGDVVLQVGVGAFDVGLFLWRRPGGEGMLAAGPVLSYYEFKRPEAEAMTEADWSRAVSKQGGFERPPWASVYLSR